MKAKIQEADLIELEKLLKIARPGKKVIKDVSVTITVSSRLSVACLGFENSMDCEALEWGTVTLPYLVWMRLLQSLRFGNDNPATLTARNGQIELNKLRIADASIRVTHHDRLPLELPLDPKPIEILKLLSLYKLETLKSSGVWDAIHGSLKRLRLQMENASLILGEYGISSRDLIMPLAEKLGIKDFHALSTILFED